MTTVQDPAATPGSGSPSGPSPAAPRVAAAGTVPPQTGRRNRLGWRARIRRDWQLYSLLVLPLLFLLVFRYLPIAGNVIAFPAIGRGAASSATSGWACTTSSCSSTTGSSGTCSRTPSSSVG